MYSQTVSFEWDPIKAVANVRKHGVQFSEAVGVFSDDYAITIKDDESDPHEQRYVTLGVARPGCCLRLSRRGPSNHLSADGRQARTRKVRGATMKDSYDFSKGRRGRVVAEPPLD